MIGRWHHLISSCLALALIASVACAQAERKRILWEIISDEEVWRLLEGSYEKAYKRAGEHLSSNERDSLDAGDPQESLHRRD